MGVFDPKRISTQQHLDIEDIRDDMVILKNGKVSIVVETSALNFDLLDSKEQDAKIYTFAAFLNSIRFPIQIVIRTQRTDIARYIKLLDSYKVRNNSVDISNQINKYQEFITDLTQNTQILDKRFFTVIPSQKLEIQNTNWIRVAFGRPNRIVNISSILQKAKEELYPKRDHIIKQYGNMGVAAKQLTNDELIKLYYSIYDPDKTGLDFMDIDDESIKKGIVTSQ